MQCKVIKLKISKNTHTYLFLRIIDRNLENILNRKIAFTLQIKNAFYYFGNLLKLQHLPWEIIAALILYEIPFPGGNKVPDKILARIFSECIHKIY